MEHGGGGRGSEAAASDEAEVGRGGETGRAEVSDWGGDGEKMQVRSQRRWGGGTKFNGSTRHSLVDYGLTALLPLSPTLLLPMNPIIIIITSHKKKGRFIIRWGFFRVEK